MRFIDCLSTSRVIYLVLVMLLCLILSAGCFPVVPDEPDEPVPVLSIDVDILGWYPCGDHHHINYSVENDGNVDVNYELEFVVNFDGHQPRTFVVESDEPLEVGDEINKSLKIQCDYCENLGAYSIDSVDVTYELWE